MCTYLRTPRLVTRRLLNRNRLDPRRGNRLQREQPSFVGLRRDRHEWDHPPGGTGDQSIRDPLSVGPFDRWAAKARANNHQPSIPRKGDLSSPKGWFSRGCSVPYLR